MITPEQIEKSAIDFVADVFPYFENKADALLKAEFKGLSTDVLVGARFKKGVPDHYKDAFAEEVERKYSKWKVKPLGVMWMDYYCSSGTPRSEESMIAFNFYYPHPDRDESSYRTSPIEKHLLEGRVVNISMPAKKLGKRDGKSK